MAVFWKASFDADVDVQFNLGSSCGYTIGKTSFFTIGIDKCKCLSSDCIYNLIFETWTKDNSRLGWDGLEDYLDEQNFSCNLITEKTVVDGSCLKITRKCRGKFLLPPLITLKNVNSCDLRKTSDSHSFANIKKKMCRLKRKQISFKQLKK